MPRVSVVGGGLAGLAATAALADSGFDVDLFESRPFLGGRAASFPIPLADGSFEVVDNCQHILLRCCVNLLDLYRRLGVSGEVEFHREFYWVEPGGRVSVLKAGGLPAPLHFTRSFLGVRFLTLAEKRALAAALVAVLREHAKRKDLHQITMADWLREKRQPQRVIERFWRQVLVSAINEDLERMAAAHGFQVFWLGFLAASNSYEMGIPAVALGELYNLRHWSRWPNLRIHLRTTVEQVGPNGITANGRQHGCDYAILAVPFERLSGLADLLEPPFDHSPITGIHLWFDRTITSLPHATLLDRTIQWMFNKGGGRHIQVVVSASRSLIPLSRKEIIELAVRELGEFFPLVREAGLVRAHVIKEVRATFSAAPGLVRPRANTRMPNVFLAGDWTDSGWPATMEGAVRSGYLAAEAVLDAAGRPAQLVLPDIA